MASIDAIFNLRDNMTTRLRRINENLENSRNELENNAEILDRVRIRQDRYFSHSNRGWREYREHLRASNNAMKGTEYVLRNMTRTLRDTESAFTVMNGATNPTQAMQGFNSLEQSIMRTRRELSMLGFGRTKMEVEALEGSLYNFANVRFKNLQDEIKRTEKAITEMQSSPDSAQYAEQIEEATQALASYKRQMLEESDAVRQIAETNGYRVSRAMGKDVIYKPYSNAMDAVEGRLNQFMNRDLGALANATYKSIDKSAKAIIGSTDGTMHEKQKIAQLTNSYMMMGQTINGMVTPAIIGMAAATGAVMATFEEGNIKFQQQTLSTNGDMGSKYSKMIDNLSIDHNMSATQVSGTMATNKNLGVSDKNLEAYTGNALEIADAWNLSGSEVATAISNADMKFKNHDVTLDAMALSLKRNGGDITGATEDLNTYFDAYNKLANGKKIDMSSIEAIAKKKANKKFDGMKNEDMLKENYVNNVTKQFKELQSVNGKNAYETIDDATGPIDSLMKGLRAVMVLVNTLGKSLSGPITAIGETIQNVATKLNSLAEAHPGITKLVTSFVALAAIAVVLIGALSPVAMLLLRFKNVFQALAQGISVMGRGVAVVNPQVLAMQKNFAMFRSAIIGLPRMMMAVFPAMLTMLRAAPLAIAKFAMDFVKMNPMFLLLAGAAVLIYKNWDRVQPLFERIWEAIKLAARPLEEFINKIKKADDGKFMDTMEKIVDVLGDTLVNALEVVTPLFEAFAKLLNGDYSGASKSFEEVGKKIGEMFDDLVSDIDMEKMFDVGVKIGKAILKGIASVISKGFSELFDYNKEAFSSGDGSKIASALGADAMAIAGSAMALGFAAKLAKTGIGKVIGGFNVAKNIGGKVVGGAKTTGSVIKAGYNVARHPVQTVKGGYNTVRNTKVRDAYTGYRLMRDEGKGRIRSTFGGYQLARPMPSPTPTPPPVVRTPAPVPVRSIQAPMQIRPQPSPIPFRTIQAPMQAQVRTVQNVNRASTANIRSTQSASRATSSFASGIGNATSKVVSTLGKIAMPLAIGADAYRFSKTEAGTRERATTTGSIAGGWGGAAAGAAAGAAVGSIVPVVGTAIGGLAGSIAGALGGGKIGEKIGGWWHDKKEPTPVPQPTPQPQPPLNTSVGSVANVSKNVPEGAMNATNAPTPIGGINSNGTADIAQQMGQIQTQIAELSSSISKANNGFVALGKVKSSASKVTSKINQISSAASKAKSSLTAMSKIKSASNKVKSKMTALASSATKAKSAMTAMSKIKSASNKVKSKMTALASATSKAKTAMTAVNKVKSSANKVKSRMTQLASATSKAKTAMRAVNKVKSSANKVKSRMTQLASATSKAKTAMNAVNKVKSSANKVKSRMNQLASASSKAKSAMTAVSRIKSSANKAKSRINQIASAASKAKSALNAVSRIKSSANKVRSAVNRVATSANKAKSSFSKLASAVNSKTGAVRGAIGKLVTSVNKAVNGANKLGDAMANKAGTISSAIDNLASNIQNAGSQATSLGSAFASLAGRVSSFQLPTISTSSINIKIPKVSANANGGLVPRMFANGGATNGYINSASRNGHVPPTGGVINRPMFVGNGTGIAGEAGAEMIIPLSRSRRSRAEALFYQTAGLLGFNNTKMYADGGVSGSRKGSKTAKAIVSASSNRSSNTGGTQNSKSYKIQNLIGQLIVQKEADEDRVIAKIRRLLEEEIFEGGNVVYDD